MYIYNPKNPPAYVYKCVERDTGRFYIGYRWKNYLPAEKDLGTKYFTSNEYVKSNWNKFDTYIIAEFFNKKDALKFEGELIKENACPLLINTDRWANIRGKKTRYRTY
jgi:hypothetical protein